MAGPGIMEITGSNDNSQDYEDAQGDATGYERVEGDSVDFSSSRGLLSN